MEEDQYVTVRKDGRNIIAFIGIGSNAGDPASSCLESIDRISAIADARVTKRSSLYWTEPVGVKSQEWFVNCAIEVEMSYSAATLLRLLQKIENDMGRIRYERWGPRTIDLDILFYGQESINDSDLIIPHPELHKRRFVLVPMYEIAPYVIHPRYGISIRGLLERLEDQAVVELLDGGASVVH